MKIVGIYLPRLHLKPPVASDTCSTCSTLSIATWPHSDSGHILLTNTVVSDTMCLMSASVITSSWADPGRVGKAKILCSIPKCSLDQVSHSSSCSKLALCKSFEPARTGAFVHHRNSPGIGVCVLGLVGEVHKLERLTAPVLSQSETRQSWGSCWIQSVIICRIGLGMTGLPPLLPVRQNGISYAWS